jgi:thiol-disulfide isomerase/thioredoxin
MKIPIKLIIVAALAVAVIAAVALKNNKRPAASPNPPARTVALAAQADPTNAAPTVNIKLPKLLDLGAGKCVPCRMMAPILEEIKKEYAGKMNVEFIDVWVNPDAAKPYGIEVIPT